MPVIKKSAKQKNALKIDEDDHELILEEIITKATLENPVKDDE